MLLTSIFFAISYHFPIIYQHFFLGMFLPLSFQQPRPKIGSATAAAPRSMVLETCSASSPADDRRGGGQKASTWGQSL